MSIGSTLSGAYNPIIVVKAVDESVTSSAVLQDDDELFFTVEANKSYVFEFNLIMNVDASADLKYKLVTPAGCTGYMLASNDGGVVDDFVALNTEKAELVTSGPLYRNLRGSVAVGGTAGVVVLQWAQNTSFGTPDTMYAGSWLRVEKATG